jgi:hypothetical protein
VQNLNVKKKASPLLACIPLLLLICTPFQHITAQEFSNIHEFIKKLSSDSLYGRGYQYDGDKKAAKLISSEFAKLGYERSVQSVRFDLNEFATSPNLLINGKPFVIAEDFLPDASTPSTDVFFNGQTISAAYSIDSTEIYLPSSESPQVILKKSNSLFHSLSGNQQQVPRINISSEVWPDSVASLSYSLTTNVNNIQSNNLIFFADSTEPFTHLITAHYDHLGTIGEVVFNGANDNASGVGMMLILADTLRNYSDDINPLFVAFTAEEAGLIGSRYFHHFYKDWWDDVSVVVNFDMVASGDGQVGLVGAVESEELYGLIENISAPERFYLKPRPNSPNSDHFWFLESGLSGFYVYTGNGKQPYHHPKDDFESLDLILFNELAEFMTTFLIESANN